MLLLFRKFLSLNHPFEQPYSGRFVLSALIFGCFFLGFALRLSWAHPLGNFSLNHYNSLEIHPDGIITQHVLDFAEIPSYNELSRVDTDGDNKVTLKEMRQYKETLRSRLLPGWILLLKLADEKAQLLKPEVIRNEVILSRGEGGLTCLLIQMVCIYESEGLSRLGEHQIVFKDRNLTQMGGVHEIRLKYYPGVRFSPAQIMTPDTSIPIALSKDLYMLSGLALTVSYQTERVDDPSGLAFTDTMLLINPASIPQTPLFPDEHGNYQVLKSPIQPRAEAQAEGSISQRRNELENTPTLFPDEPAAADESVVPSDRKLSNEEDSAYSRSSTDVNWTNLIDTKDLSLTFILLAVGLSILFGASHALSPGHGKTIVAAYLVGSRGTVKHAIFLGLVVTLTHVSGVFLLGVVTLYFSQYIVPDKLYPIIESASGLLIIAVGMTIFLKRYGAYQKLRFAESLGIRVEDHGHHHPDHHHSHKHPHDHMHGDGHSHGHGTHRHEIPADVSFKDLLLLGITGGIVPCPSAVVVLVAAIALHRILFGLALIVFFSVGLATVLIGIGILMVSAKWVFDRLQNHGNAIRWLQIVSPVLVILLGIAILIRGLQAAGLIRFYQ